MEIPTLINANSTIKGELILTTDSRVDGKIFGKVETNQTLVIGSDGYFKGSLRARNLIVFGKVEGNILVSGEAIFHSDASFIGTLYTRVFDIKEGAAINARIETFDESKTFEEVQSDMAEELIRSQTNSSHLPLDLKAPTASENAEETHLTDFSTNQEKVLEQLPSVLAEMAVNISQKYEEMEPAPNVVMAKGEILNYENQNLHLQKREEKRITKPMVKSALFSSLLENSVKESSTFYSEKSYHEESDHGGNNHKENSVSGFNELRNLLIHPKFCMANPDVRLNAMLKSNSNMTDEDGMNKKPKRSDDGEFFHFDSLMGLPSKDI